MRKQCANPACQNYYTPSRETRPHEPCCSVACFQAYRDLFAGHAQPTQAVHPHSPQPTRPQVNRRNARQNWRMSGE
jgi:hypothetical protein